MSHACVHQRRCHQWMFNGLEEGAGHSAVGSVARDRNSFSAVSVCGSHEQCPGDECACPESAIAACGAPLPLHVAEKSTSLLEVRFHVRFTQPPSGMCGLWRWLARRPRFGCVIISTNEESCCPVIWLYGWLRVTRGVGEQGVVFVARVDEMQVRVVLSRFRVLSRLAAPSFTSNNMFFHIKIPHQK